MKTEAKQYITDKVTKEFYIRYPWLEEKFGEKGKKHTREDNDHHLNHLELSYKRKDESFFSDYTVWLNDVLVSRGVGTKLIIENYEMIGRYLQEVDMHGDERDYYIRLLESSIAHLKRITDTG
ncbi:hypothetical protein AAV35_003610 [Salimicrobium jeotgali]|uniref:Uncharacterized protein n=1 Tax=Salimicrobium jeotgali TaxID=1230341 RepID=K2GRH0_9BACI|nr:hypothetical protein [Salimicrobium jeotgali]AKG03963.1 hypothetical protein AAV35_003610 [Salimicrobium jeotgali]EKE32999.1 hypothetical protein MJ3_00825 [Salimicrobium jeotgali]MBM7695006.1 hypothetical protein [Salimicrobium jeotgali]